MVLQNYMWWTDGAAGGPLQRPRDSAAAAYVASQPERSTETWMLLGLSRSR